MYTPTCVRAGGAVIDDLHPGKQWLRWQKSFSQTLFSAAHCAWSDGISLQNYDKGSAELICRVRYTAGLTPAAHGASLPVQHYSLF